MQYEHAAPSPPSPSPFLSVDLPWSCHRPQLAVMKSCPRFMEQHFPRFCLSQFQLFVVYSLCVCVCSLCVCACRSGCALANWKHLTFDLCQNVKNLTSQPDKPVKKEKEARERGRRRGWTLMKYETAERRLSESCFPSSSTSSDLCFPTRTD